MAKKMVLKHTDTFIGTPEYQSPQIIGYQNYGYETDWWSFGTLLYELVIGIPPFFDMDKSKMYQNIMNKQVKFPSNNIVSDSFKDLIINLLDKDPQKRLGK